MEDKFKENNVDLHKHEVEVLEDDHRKGVRRLQVKNTKYYTWGNVSDERWNSIFGSKQGHRH